MSCLDNDLYPGAFHFRNRRTLCSLWLTIWIFYVWWVGHVARMGEGRGVHWVMVGKPEGKRPLGRPRRRWADNIKMDLQEVGGSCGDWMELAQDRDRWRALVSTVRNLRVPKMWGISWLAAEPVSFSRRTLLHGVSKYVQRAHLENCSKDRSEKIIVSKFLLSRINIRWVLAVTACKQMTEIGSSVLK